MLTIDNVNPAVLKTEYAVRGEIAIEAERLRDCLQAGQQLGFTEIVNANIGNPQQLGQPPLSFWRQVIALTECPELIDSAPVPDDVKRRASELLQAIGSTGAYTHSQGIPLIRRHVAEFIERRDGFDTKAENIYLTAGASAGVSMVLQMLSGHEDDGVLIPRPQYPLYSASLAQNRCHAIYYDVLEGDEWTLDVDMIRKTIERSKVEGVKPRAIAVINPGNPTGSCINVETMKGILNLCREHNLVLLADEVYQDNIFAEDRLPFVSFKKQLMSSEPSIRSHVQLFSFHSISKGLSGECGKRGGYFEAVNIPNEVMKQIYKLASVNLCAPVVGQIGVDLLVRPPREGEPSFALWKRETESIRSTLKQRNHILCQRLNRLENVSCAKTPGALYLFPKIVLPEAAIQAARKVNQQPDTFYCLALLKETGVVVVPGNGFGQEEGTFHFRTTILAPGAEEYVQKISAFHQAFCDRFR